MPTFDVTRLSSPIISTFTSQDISLRHTLRLGCKTTHRTLVLRRTCSCLEFTTRLALQLQIIFTGGFVQIHEYLIASPPFHNDHATHHGYARDEERIAPPNTAGPAVDHAVIVMGTDGYGTDSCMVQKRRSWTSALRSLLLWQLPRICRCTVAYPCRLNFDKIEGFTTIFPHMSLADGHV